MEIQQTELPGVLIVEPRVFEDSRGFFLETFHKQRYAVAGIDCEFVQDNLSRSCRGTLRGLHFQIQHAQAKLVSVVRGEIFDVAVDLRRDSSHFGRWVGVTLNAEDHRQLFIPPGFAHGFCVLSEMADFQYKCSDIYYPEHERTLLWNDSDLNIAWPLEGEPILSDKDRRGIPLSKTEGFS